MSIVTYTGSPGAVAQPGQFDPRKQPVAAAGEAVQPVAEVRVASGAHVAGMPPTARARASVRMGRREQKV